MRAIEIIPYTPEYRSLEKDRGRRRLFGILFFWLDPKEPKGQGCGEQFTALPCLTQPRPSDLRPWRSFSVSLGPVGGSHQFHSLDFYSTLCQDKVEGTKRKTNPSFLGEREGMLSSVKRIT